MSSAPGAVELCKLPKLQTLPAKNPECLFYTGTERYRHQDYAAAKLQWQALVDLAELPLEDEHLKTSAYNNLGFLYYMGLGVPVNRARAIAYWDYASKRGHEESAYHLCHAYGDASAPEYDPRRALGNCREALRRYGQLSDPDKGNAEAVAQIREIIARLEAGKAKAPGAN